MTAYFHDLLKPIYLEKKTFLVLSQILDPPEPCYTFKLP